MGNRKYYVVDIVGTRFITGTQTACRNWCDSKSNTIKPGESLHVLSPGGTQVYALYNISGIIHKGKS